LIDRFIMSARADPCLVGEIHGHPCLSGPRGVTSSYRPTRPDWAGRARSRDFTD
jgi:hypothetical protein